MQSDREVSANVLMKHRYLTEITRGKEGRKKPPQCEPSEEMYVFTAGLYIGGKGQKLKRREMRQKTQEQGREMRGGGRITVADGDVE